MSDSDYTYTFSTPRAVSAPPQRQALTCREDALVRNLFHSMVLDEKEIPASVFENNSVEFCHEFIDGLYKKAEATVKRENQPRRS